MADPSVGGSDLDFGTLAKDLAAVADPARLEMLKLLVKPQRVEEIASRVRLDPALAQKHLDVLVGAGLVRRELRPLPGTTPIVVYQAQAQRVFALAEDVQKLGRAEESDDLGKTQAVLKVSRAGALLSGPTLVVTHGLKLGSAFRLQGNGPWTLGRDAGAFVVVDYDPFASTKHAEIVLKGGSHVLVDAASRNGTFLNWEKLARGGEKALAPGDVIGVGKTLLVYRK